MWNHMRIFVKSVENLYRIKSPSNTRNWGLIKKTRPPADSIPCLRK